MVLKISLKTLRITLKDWDTSHDDTQYNDTMRASLWRMSFILIVAIIFINQSVIMLSVPIIIAIIMIVVILSVVASFNENNIHFEILFALTLQKTTFNLNCLIHSSADIMGATTFNITTLSLMKIPVLPVSLKIIASKHALTGHYIFVWVQPLKWEQFFTEYVY